METREIERELRNQGFVRRGDGEYAVRVEYALSYGDGAREIVGITHRDDHGDVEILADNYEAGEDSSIFRRPPMTPEQFFMLRGQRSWRAVFHAPFNGHTQFTFRSAAPTDASPRDYGVDCTETGEHLAVESDSWSEVADEIAAWYPDADVELLGAVESILREDG